MKQLAMIVLAASAALIGLVGCGGDGGSNLPSAPAVALSTGPLTGGQVVPAPGVSTTATGNFTGVIAEDQSSINFQLDYQGLSSEITAATLHVARPTTSLSVRQVNGPAVLYLCATSDFPRVAVGLLPDRPNSVPTGTAECSGQSSNVTGTKVASAVVALGGTQLVGSVSTPNGNAIAPALALANTDLGILVREILNGNTYVLVRSTNFPAGEIRGQISAQQ